MNIHLIINCAIIAVAFAYCAWLLYPHGICAPPGSFIGRSVDGALSEQAGKIRATAENEPPGAIRDKLLLIAAQYEDLVKHHEEPAGRTLRPET
jgi:hypothetical protein